MFRIWTQVLLLEEQVLLPTETSHQPSVLNNTLRQILWIFFIALVFKIYVVLWVLYNVIWSLFPFPPAVPPNLPLPFPPNFTSCFLHQGKCVLREYSLICCLLPEHGWFIKAYFLEKTDSSFPYTWELPIARYAELWEKVQGWEQDQRSWNKKSEMVS